MISKADGRELRAALRRAAGVGRRVVVRLRPADVTPATAAPFEGGEHHAAQGQDPVKVHMLVPPQSELHVMQRMGPGPHVFSGIMSAVLRALEREGGGGARAATAHAQGECPVPAGLGAGAHAAT